MTLRGAAHGGRTARFPREAGRFVFVLGFAFAVGACAQEERRPPTFPPATDLARSVSAVVEQARPAPPLLVIGLDGADWAFLDARIAAGEMPELERLVDEGLRGDLRTEHPPLSPLLWTTMMTGVSPLEHRILDFSRFRPGTGEREPITADERGAPAIWNLATWAGKTIGVFGLWATYPAEPVRGVLVSDRLFGFLHRQAAPPPGIVFPPTREAWARAALERAEAAVDWPRLREMLPDLEEAEPRRALAAERPYEDPVSALRRILVETEVYDGLCRDFLAEPGPAPDVAVLYLQGTDTIGHVFAPYWPPRRAEVSPRDFERYQDVPRRYFRQIDARLGFYRAAVERRGGTLLLVSDHGFVWGEGRPERLSSVDNATAAQWHRPDGIWLAWAPAGAPGAVLAGAGLAAGGAGATGRAGIRQVAATIAALAGIPLGGNLATPPLVWRGVEAPPSRREAGDVDYTALFAAFRQRWPAGGAASPGPRDASPGGGEELAQELEKLRALGYLGGGEPAAAPASVLAEGSTRTAGSWNHEALLHKSAGHPEEARRALEQALRVDPGSSSALWNLSELLREQGQDGEADRRLLQAVSAGLWEGGRRLIERARVLRQVAGPVPAAGLLEAALADRDGPMARDPAVWLFWGRYEIERGRCAQALEGFARAGALRPEDPQAPASAAVALLCLGRREEAAGRLRRSLALDPEQPQVARMLETLTEAH